MDYQYFIVYKPFGMLSQFTREVEGQVTLADLDYTFPKNVYPVGRLDRDSEGLLLLTNDKRLNAALLNPSKKKQKRYWAQVEGTPSIEAIQGLEAGVTIRIKKKTYKTLPAQVQKIEIPSTLPNRIPPIRVRKSIPDTWIAITIYEGKNRQVRRMFAAFGFPVLRLIRVGFASLTLSFDNLQPGMVQEISRSSIST